MSETPLGQPPEGRRILVALDTSPFSRWAIDLAAALATELRSELEGLFYEDDDLVKLAGLPFSREFGYTSTGGRALSPAGMRSLLKTCEEELRRSLQKTCGTRQLRWSLTVVRGRALPHLLGPDTDADLLVIGVERRPSLTRPTTQPRPSTVVVLFDGSPAACRAVQLGATAAGSGGPLVVMPIAREAAELQPLREQAEALGTPGFIHPVRIESVDDLCSAIRQQHAQVVLAPRDGGLFDRRGLGQLLDRLDCLVLLVR